MGEGFGIGELADRTGVPQATLRTWESRYGMPRPRRLPAGHRRYTLADVALVEAVVQLRDSGLTMPMAITQAGRETKATEPSLFAALRRRHPGLVTRAISKRSLLALTRAIEDECCAQAHRPVLFAAFQEARFYRQSAERWKDLTRSAQSAVVFADFGRKQRPAKGVPLRVHLPADTPLRREWLLVCDSSDLPACIAGWELPGQSHHPGQSHVPDARRRFETLWSVDARVVRDAAQVCARIATEHGPGQLDLGPEIGPPARPSADMVRAERLFQRFVDYLDTTARS